MSDGPLTFDCIVLACLGCRGERTFYPDSPLVGAQALIDWMNTKAVRCSCGAERCDVKARMKETKSDG